MLNTFWFVYFILTILFAHFGKYQVAKNRIVVFCSRICLITTFSIVLALFGIVGTDHRAYTEFYYHINNFNLHFNSVGEFLLEKGEGIISPTENGYILLMKLTLILNLNHVGFFFVGAFITNFFVVNTFYKFRYPVLSFMTYIVSTYFFQEMNLVRQMMAVCIFVGAIDCIEKHKWKRYLIFLLFAFSIHQSSIIGIIFLPFCFVQDIANIWKYIKWTIAPFYILSLLIALNVITFDLSLFSLILSAYDYQDYALKDSISGEVPSIDILYNCIIILILLFYKGEKGKYMYVISYIIGGVIFNFSPQAPYLMRLSLYFSFISIPLVTHLLGGGDLIKSKWISHSVLSVFYLYYSLVMIKASLLGLKSYGEKMDVFQFFLS